MSLSLSLDRSIDRIKCNEFCWFWYKYLITQACIWTTDVYKSPSWSKETKRFGWFINWPASTFTSTIDFVFLYLVEYIFLTSLLLEVVFFSLVIFYWYLKCLFNDGHSWSAFFKYKNNWNRFNRLKWQKIKLSFLILFQIKTKIVCTDIYSKKGNHNYFLKKNPR